MRGQRQLRVSRRGEGRRRVGKDDKQGVALGTEDPTASPFDRGADGLRWSDSAVA
jgi:hypothetical protein